MYKVLMLFGTNYSNRRMQSSVKPVPRRFIIDWVLTAWKTLPKDMMASTFTKCAYTIADNGNGGEKIGET